LFKKNIKKIDLIKNLSNKTGFSLSFCKKIVNDLIEILILNIKEGNLYLKDVGSFKIIHKAERLGRNPKTKKEHIITSRKSLSFSPSNRILSELDKFL
tara:strand:+ start:906 stop:1199 length:294 start_codon:yes stop_codon:yes gene_type:complete